MKIFDAHRKISVPLRAGLLGGALLWGCAGELSSGEGGEAEDASVAAPEGGADEAPTGGHSVGGASMGGEPMGGELAGGAAGEGPTLPPFEPAPPRLSRLTVAQYHNTLADLFGASLRLPADLEADTPLHGFSVIGGGELTVSPRAAEQYEAAAMDVAAQLFDEGQGPSQTGCPEPTAECLGGYLERLGLRLWRRPLTDTELRELTALAEAIEAELGDPWAGIEMTVAAMLQSPDFLFRVEIGAPGPRGRTLDAYELASRVSYFLWQSAPDEALLRAAAEGILDTPEGLRAEASRMLDDPRAARGLIGFFAEAFTLDRLVFLDKSRELFPQMTPTLGASMRREVEAMVRWLVIDEDADLRGLLTSRSVFVDGALASLYGLPAPAAPDEMSRVELPGGHPRGGLLGTGAFLAMNAHATVTSPTLRGKFVQNHLLCFDIPPPPPGISTSLAPDEAGAPPTTTREKLARHREDDTCAGCHVYMDPLGLALENYDAIGAWRTLEAGQPIDPSGELDGEAFMGGRALSALIAAREEFTACQVRRLYRYALGHLESRGEARAIAELESAFEASGWRFRALALAVVEHEAFRRLGEPVE